MKKILLIFVFLMAVISCVNEESQEKKIVLITMDSLDEHWFSVKKGAEESVKRYDGYTLVFRAPAGKTDPNEQTRMVEDAINQDVAAILLAPTDGAALAPVVAKVKAAGIPMILIDSPISTEDYDAFLSTDNEVAGRLAADTMAALIDNTGKIAIVHAQAASGTAIDRGKGFEDRIKEIAPGVKIVSIQYSDGDKARALNIATDIMTANPDLIGFYTSNEGSTVGVARAIEEKGLVGKVKLVGFDKSQDTVRVMESGILNASMVQNPEFMGSKGIDYAVQLITKEGDVPRETDTGVTVVTLENINLIK
ncbi:MAG: ABC transporter substrate-binding protein [Brevinema sp.]